LGAGLLKTSKKGFTADTSILQQRVVAACAAAGKKVKLTNSGKTQTSKDVIQDIAEFDSLLTTYQTYKKHEKNISTYLTPLATSGGRLHTSANVLVATGRTSWREPSLQVFPGVPGIRESFLPEDGHYLLSVDYDSLELRVLSQCLLWIVGKSAMAEGYIKDPGFDPHSKVGAILAGTTYEEFLKNKDTNPTYDKLRKMAKAANFGFAGGMGVDSFIDFAKTYKVLLDRQGVWKLKNAYFKAYPEMKEYFVYVNEMINREVAFQQLPSGRLRGGVGFCDGCNTFFQGGAADGAKLAMAHIYNQSLAKGTTLFGTKMVAFIHDEFLLSTPKETAHEAAQEVVDIMETKMRAVFPDIPFKASPALMTCWIKAAKAKYSNGRLVPYDNGRGD
jgi:DNA polymerase I-like protein with 3'-5' exonuclease and polymerase domains